MGLSVREVRPTPNPNAKKFVLEAAHFAEPLSFFDASSASGNDIAEKLFRIDGVESILLLNDFITVNKTGGASWSVLTKKVKQTLATLDGFGAKDAI